MHFIEYRTKRYPYREIKLPEFGYIAISVESLSSVLLNDNFTYSSKEAQHIDEKIFFFVEDKMISQSEETLRKYFKELNL